MQIYDAAYVCNVVIYFRKLILNFLFDYMKYEDMLLGGG